MSEPFIKFSKVKESLRRIGIIVDKAKDAYVPISPEEVSLKEIENGSLQIDTDGIFIIGEDGVRRQVFLYKRAYNMERFGKPRFHICKCQTIEEFMNSSGEIPEYRRANTRAVMVLDRSNGNQDTKVEDLPLCKYCAQLIGSVARNMDSAAFVELLKKANPADEERPQGNINVNTRTGYTEDWQEVSQRFRERHHYTCERCGVQVSQFETEYMQVHHRNGDKTNNSDSNLECLCIKCHSEVDPTHVRNFSTRQQQMLIRFFMDNYASKRNIHFSDPDLPF